MQIYRSPTTGTPAAATTPARLTDEFDAVLWRELPDGGIEIAARRKRQVERLRVHDDGSTSPLGTIAIPRKGLGRRRGQWWSDLGPRETWHQPTDLHGWTPLSVAQLAAVERIADEHNGFALVRDRGETTIDVCAPRKGLLDRYTVDERGSVAVDPTPPPRFYRLRHVLRMVVLPLAAFLGLPLLGASFSSAGALLGIAAAITVTIWITRQEPHERLKRGAAGDRWIEIRTKIDDSD